MLKFLLTLIVLVALGGAAYLYFYPDEAARYLAGTPLKNGLGNTTRPLYQWKDDKGRWQVTDSPPPEGTPYERKQYPVDANVLPMSELLKKGQ